ncbi:MAG: hypothetical protein EHM64_09600 [Ignavibacteriae bacterium]|nr:MAG: hypothetical protein EHM64_09600 [Ignavibacteriota bacterium]
MERCALAFFLTFGLIQWSQAQSEYLLRGRSGIGGGLEISSDHEKNSLALVAGYSFRGVLDASLKYSKANGGHVQGGVLSPIITIYPVKQEDAENIPTLGISLGFSRYLSKTSATVIVPDSAVISWRSYERTNEAAINSWNLGVTAQSRTGNWKVFFFQPLLGANFFLTNKGSEFKLRCGLSVGTRLVRGPLVIVTPEIARQSGLTIFVIRLTTVFS